MKPTLDWLLGERLLRVEKKDYTWFFNLEGSGSIATESIWRLLVPERILITSEDNGHVFGLKKPVDAGECVMTTVQKNKIARYSCVEISSDLILYFEGGAQLQFLNLSGGYESWRATNDNGQVICMGGGGLSIFATNKKE